MRTRDVKSVEVKVSTELQPGPSAKRMALGSIAAKSHDMHLRQPVGGQGLHPFPPSTVHGLRRKPAGGHHQVKKIAGAVRALEGVAVAPARVVQPPAVVPSRTGGVAVTGRGCRIAVVTRRTGARGGEAAL
jgi:hypothetical protein